MVGFAPAQPTLRFGDALRVKFLPRPDRRRRRDRRAIGAGASLAVRAARPRGDQRASDKPPMRRPSCDGPLALQSAGEWSQVWRWELAPPNAAPRLLQGDGVFSSLRMSRLITSLAMPEGTRWLFRLDQIISAAGRIADRHQHPGPGIRCLIEGTFNVQQDAESAPRLGAGRCLVGDRIGHSDRLELAADGGAVPARHGAARRVGRQGHRHLAVGTHPAAGQLETLPRPHNRGLAGGGTRQFAMPALFAGRRLNGGRSKVDAKRQSAHRPVFSRSK